MLYREEQDIITQSEYWRPLNIKTIDQWEPAQTKLKSENHFAIAFKCKVKSIAVLFYTL